MLVAVRWAQVRLFWNKADRFHYVQLGDDSLFKVNPNIAEKIAHKLQIEIKEAQNIRAIQQNMTDDKSA